MLLAFSIRLGSHGLATVEQESDADICQSVALLLDTRPGQRAAVPEYGLPDTLFGDGLDETTVLEAVTAWVPYAQIEEFTIDNLSSPRTRNHDRA